MITLPALLSAGLPPHLALGTNKLAGTFGTLSATRVYMRKGIFSPRLWRPVIVATFIGALIGALATRLFSAESLNKFLPLLIIAAALYVTLPRPVSSPASRPKRRAVGLSLGGILGFYDGFSGPGTGAFWVGLAMKVYAVDLLTACGIARFMNLVSNLVALLTFMLLGSVNYRIGLALGLSLMVGAHIGAHSAIKFGHAFIRPAFVVVVLTLAVRLAWIEWLG